MTDRIALFLAILVLTAIVVDIGVFGTQHTVFLGKKLSDLIEWLAFWR